MLWRYFAPLTTEVTKDTKIYVGDTANYPLTAMTLRIPHSFFRIGGLDCNPWILDWNNRFNPYYNRVLLNPRAKVWIDGRQTTASELSPEDTVTVEARYEEFEQDQFDLDTSTPKNVYFQQKGRVHITETVHEQACVIPGALGRYNKDLGPVTSDQISINKLLNGKLGYINPVHGGIETSCLVRVFKSNRVT